MVGKLCLLALSMSYSLKDGGATKADMSGLECTEDVIDGTIVDAKKAELLEEDGALSVGETGGLRLRGRGGGGTAGIDAGNDVCEKVTVTLVHVMVEVSSVGGNGTCATRATTPAGVLLAIGF